MEISVIRDNKTVFEFNNSNKKDLNRFAGKILKDRKMKTYICLALASTSILTGLSVKDLIYPTLAACNVNLGSATSTVQNIMTEVVGFAKIGLIGMVIFNTILGVLQTIWKKAGSSLSYEEIFGILFKNLTILLCGLSVDKICWWLYGMLK